MVLQVLANKLWAAGYVLDPIDEGVVWNYRLTRALVAAACGAGLATCGVILQSLLAFLILISFYSYKQDLIHSINSNILNIQ